MLLGSISFKNKKIVEQSMGAHGGESPTRKANARRHVAHAHGHQHTNKENTKPFSSQLYDL